MRYVVTHCYFGAMINDYLKVYGKYIIKFTSDP